MNRNAAFRKQTVEERRWMAQLPLHGRLALNRDVRITVMEGRRLPVRPIWHWGKVVQ